MNNRPEIDRYVLTEMDEEGNVWCAGKYLYQATDIVGNMITDIHLMLTGGDASQMTFMTKID